MDNKWNKLPKTTAVPSAAISLKPPGSSLIELCELCDQHHLDIAKILQPLRDFPHDGVVCGLVRGQQSAGRPTDGQGGLQALQGTQEDAAHFRMYLPVTKVKSAQKIGRDSLRWKYCTKEYVDTALNIRRVRFCGVSCRLKTHLKSTRSGFLFVRLMDSRSGS